jgi:beta-1,4-N-acetylglucosaminyltransferase
MNICLVASPGGHLTELLLFRFLFEKYDYFLISTDWPRVKNMPIRKYLVPLSTKRPLTLFPTLAVIARAFRAERPRAVISTGAEVAIPVFAVAKCFGIKTVFIETCTRFENATLTGRILYPLADKFFVQNRETLSRYGRKAEFHGGPL